MFDPFEQLSLRLCRKALKVFDVKRATHAGLYFRGHMSVGGSVLVRKRLAEKFLFDAVLGYMGCVDGDEALVGSRTFAMNPLGDGFLSAARRSDEHDGRVCFGGIAGIDHGLPHGG